MTNEEMLNRFIKNEIVFEVNYGAGKEPTGKRRLMIEDYRTAMKTVTLELSNGSEILFPSNELSDLNNAFIDEKLLGENEVINAQLKDDDGNYQAIYIYGIEQSEVEKDIESEEREIAEFKFGDRIKFNNDIEIENQGFYADVSGLTGTIVPVNNQFKHLLIDFPDMVSVKLDEPNETFEEFKNEVHFYDGLVELNGIAKSIDSNKEKLKFSEIKKLNNAEFAYYVLNNENKIIKGFEYKEDANDFKREMKHEKLRVVLKKDLPFGVSGANDDSNWGTSSSVHTDFIERAKKCYIIHARKFDDELEMMGIHAPFMNAKEMDEAVDDKKAINWYIIYIGHMIAKAVSFGIKHHELDTMLIEAISIKKSLM